MSWISDRVLEMYLNFIRKKLLSVSANSVFTKTYLYHLKKTKQDLNYIQKIIKHDLVSQSDQKHSLYFFFRRNSTQKKALSPFSHKYMKMKGHI